MPVSLSANRTAWTIVAGVTLLLIIVLSLIGASLNGVDYYEIGFKRRRTTGSVDTSKVFSQGLYFTGPDYEFKTFPSIAHLEKFERISIFNADRLTVTISARIQYFLRPHQLKLLHKTYDIYYAPILRKNALDALKGAVTVFTNREMILERDRIERTLFKTVKERLGGRCCEKNCTQAPSKASPDDKYMNVEPPGRCVDGCKAYSTCTENDYGLFADVRYFQLHELIIPRGLMSRFLKALTLKEEQEREKLRQQAIIMRKETDQLVNQRNNYAAEIQQNATAQSDLIQDRATAIAKAMLERARSDGLRGLYTKLNITTPEHKSAFDYLRTLRQHQKLRLAVEYQTYISGPQIKT